MSPLWKPLEAEGTSPQPPGVTHTLVSWMLVRDGRPVVLVVLGVRGLLVDGGEVPPHHLLVVARQTSDEAVGTPGSLTVPDGPQHEPSVAVVDLLPLLRVGLDVLVVQRGLPGVEQSGWVLSGDGVGKLPTQEGLHSSSVLPEDVAGGGQDGAISVVSLATAGADAASGIHAQVQHHRVDVGDQLLGDGTVQVLEEALPVDDLGADGAAVERGQHGEDVNGILGDGHSVCVLLVRMLCGVG